MSIPLCSRLITFCKICIAFCTFPKMFQQCRILFPSRINIIVYKMCIKWCRNKLINYFFTSYLWARSKVKVSLSPVTHILSLHGVQVSNIHIKPTTGMSIWHIDYAQNISHYFTTDLLSHKFPARVYSLTEGWSGINWEITDAFLTVTNIFRIKCLGTWIMPRIWRSNTHNYKLQIQQCSINYWEINLWYPLSSTQTRSKFNPQG